MRHWHARWSRFRDLLRGRRVDRDIDDELRFHLEEELAAGIRRGLTPDRARQAAHSSLGATPLLMREQIRDARHLSRIDDFRRDVHHGVRLLGRSPAFASVVIGTLAVAIGATVTAFSVTDAWLFRSLRFPDADRLAVAFVGTAANPGEPAVFLPYRAYLAFRESSRTFASVSAAFFHGVTWRTASGAKSLTGMRVTPEFFSTFGVPPLRGRALTAADAGGSPAVVISYGFWQRELGGLDAVLGRAVTLGDVAYTIVGVMPPAFDVRMLDQAEGAAFWTLLRPGARGYEPDGVGPVAVIGRLADGVTFDAARADLSAILRRTEAAYPINFNQPQTVNGVAMDFVVNLSSLQGDNTRTVRATLLTVLAAALCLLLIAAMNIGVLLLGRDLGRRGEVAIRHALGAGRSRLARQFLAESLVLSVCGGALGVGLAIAGTRLFVAWNPLGRLPANGVEVDLRVAAAALVAMAVTALVAGLVPAIRLSAAGPAAALQRAGRGTAPSQRAQQTMLAGQMAVSTVLLVCAALLARTFVQLRTEPLGFVTEDVAVAQVELPMAPADASGARHAFFRQLEERLLARPGVRAVAASTSPPLVSGTPATVNTSPVDEASAPRMGLQDVTSGFFEMLEIPVVAGRAFDARDTAAVAPVVVLNARAASNLYGDPHRAVGQRIRLDSGEWREIVGVVGNVKTTFFNTLEWRTEPIIYRPAAQTLSRTPPAAASFTLWVHVRSDRPISPADVRGAARGVGARADVIGLERVTDLVAAATRQPTFRMTLLLGFCLASLLLAAIGVYGLVTQAVAERLREIAIRLALGASPGAVMARFVRRALVAGASGLAIGVVLAMVLARTLESMLYGVRTGDAVSMTASGGLLLAVTALAAWLPALRATRADAVRVLRG